MITNLAATLAATPAPAPVEFAVGYTVAGAFGTRTVLVYARDVTEAFRVAQDSLDASMINWSAMIDAFASE